MFYGLIFNESDPYIQNIATAFSQRRWLCQFLTWKSGRYALFPLITNAHYPSWFPFWGGEEFEFFRPVFNIADASISIGVIANPDFPE